MSKRAITRLYFGAWVAWFLSLVAFVVAARLAHAGGAPAPAMTVAGVVMVVAGLVTWLMWAAALLKLARQAATPLFIAVLVLQWVGLGIIGMVAYALTRSREGPDYVIRPSFT